LSREEKLLRDEKQRFARGPVLSSVFDSPEGRHYHTAPMSASRAEEVDVSLLATQGAALERRFPLSDFGRLQKLLATPPLDRAHAVRARFEFALEHQRPVARVEVKASLPLVCQRCLQMIEWPVASSAQLVFVDGAAATGEIDGRDVYETRAGHVALAGVVEEELLLALPLVAMHAAAAECEALASPMAAPAAATGQATPTAGDAQRPFAGLKELLGRK
jgi:uncharacterized protein